MSDQNSREPTQNPTGQQPQQQNAQNKAQQSGGGQPASGQPQAQGQQGQGQQQQAQHSGAHEAQGGEQVKSRSADPGQSSYGGFKGENPAGQAIDDKKQDKR